MARRVPELHDPTRMPSRPCVRCRLTPPLVRFYWTESIRRWSSRCLDCNAEILRERRATPEGKAARRRYHERRPGREAKKKYERSDKGKATRRRYLDSPTGKSTRAASEYRRQVARATSALARKRAERRLAAALAELARIDRQRESA